MHYYQFNIGDYASHTSRLTPIEDIAYRRMLDLYYLNEQPLNGCESDVAREIGLSDQLESVKYVLSKFFVKEENIFRQKRIDVEIKKYKSNSKNKSKAGKASAKARQAKALSKSTGVEQVLNTEPTDEQLNINHKPITNNQLKDSKDLLSGKPDSIEVIEYMNQALGSKYKSSTKSHMQNINARIDEGHSIEDLKMVVDSKKTEWGKDPNMAQYLRPQTLFGSKFNGYLTAAKTKPAQGINQIGSNFDKPEGW